MLRRERYGLSKRPDGPFGSAQDLQYGPVGVVRERIGRETLHQKLRMGKRIGGASGVQGRKRANLAGLVAVWSDREGPGGELLGLGPKARLHRLVRLADEGVELCPQGQGKRFRVKDL